MTASRCSEKNHLTATIEYSSPTGRQAPAHGPFAA